MTDREVVVSVTDQGQGLHPDDLSKLFKMFGKARGRPTDGEKSTGLGLVISKNIVDAHGGRIWVESKGIGMGSTFKFKLPLLKCNEEEQEERTLTLNSVLVSNNSSKTTNYNRGKRYGKENNDS